MHIAVADSNVEILDARVAVRVADPVAHPARQGAALVAAARLLDGEGRFVVIMPHPCNPDILRSRWFGPRFEVPLNHLTPRGLAQLARAVGLRLVACERMPYGGFGRLLHRWPFMAGAYAACFALA